jgi:hypothetical protein
MAAQALSVLATVQVAAAVVLVLLAATHLALQVVTVALV